MNRTFSIFLSFIFIVIWSIILCTLFVIFLVKDKTENKEGKYSKKIDSIVFYIVSFVFVEMWFGGCYAGAVLISGLKDKSFIDVAITGFEGTFFLVGIPIILSIAFTIFEFFKEMEMQFSCGIYYVGSFIFSIFNRMEIGKELLLFFSYLVSTLICVIIYLKIKKKS